MPHHHHEKKHTLKVFHYTEGELEVTEYFFGSLEDAKEHSKHHKGKGLRKIYNEIEELVHCDDDDDNETYA